MKNLPQATAAALAAADRLADELSQMLASVPNLGSYVRFGQLHDSLSAYSALRATEPAKPLPARKWPGEMTPLASAIRHLTVSLHSEVR